MAKRGTGSSANSTAWLQKVDVQGYRTQAISSTSLFIIKLLQYILLCTDMHQIQTSLYIHLMKYHCRTPQHGSTVEHGNKGRVMNPSLAGDVEITVSKCNRLYLILVVVHRRKARLISRLRRLSYFDILNMGVLMKLIVSGRADKVCTRYVPSIFWYVPLTNQYVLSMYLYVLCIYVYVLVHY